MKKYFLTFILISVYGFTNFIFSWDPESAKYFPMEVGNSWTYVKKIFSPPLGCISSTSSYNFKVTITGDSIINGHRYFKFSNGNLLRLDSTSMNVYKRNGNTECLTDSLLARLYDFVHDCTGSIQVRDTNIIVFAGQKRFTKAVSFPGLTRRIMYGIGLYYEGGCELFSGTVDELKGCVINGVLIGDTTVTPVNYDFMQYLPLQVGNIWVYSWKGHQPIPPWDDSGLYRVKVDNIINRNNKLYYTFTLDDYNIASCNGGFGDIFANNYLRIDSLSGNVMAWDTVNGCSYSTGERMVDSLKMQLNDSVNFNCQSIFRSICNDTSWQNIFGSSRQSKSLLHMGVEAGEYKRFVKGIGIGSFGQFIMFYQCNYTLRGCVINGIVYGDTSMTGITKISSEVPVKFRLFQNYPNPFNPVTKIRFEIPVVGAQYIEPVQLKIYDVLGREITTLVNEQLSPGTYEVEFDGTNYPSGIYYYTLTAGEYIQTKRMVLLK